MVNGSFRGPKERRSFKPKVAGSNPVGRIPCCSATCRVLPGGESSLRSGHRGKGTFTRRVDAQPGDRPGGRGIVAGVVLERHLKGVLANHQLSLGRKKSQIGNLNNALKEDKVIDIPRWREISRLGDIRNLCGHDGVREPTAEEVEELLKETEKIIASIF